MKKLFQRVFAFICAAEASVVCSIYALADTVTDTKGMGNFFEKIYDKIFKDAFNSFFEKHRAEIQLRVKTGIVVTLFVILLCLLLIVYFLITKKKETPEEDDEDEYEEDEDDSDDEDDCE
jgi:hypothetical protein